MRKDNMLLDNTNQLELVDIDLPKAKLYIQESFSDQTVKKGIYFHK